MRTWDNRGGTGDQERSDKHVHNDTNGDNNMKDADVNWRNHRWYFDADYVERTAAPLLSSLIARYGFIFDDDFAYILHGKYKRYIVRFPHYNGTRWNPRIPAERPKDPFQQKLRA